ncbi:hypothetical protein EON65_07585 [archaeon]|nr:MAG: hypothetical protein EON65_07585 [archaeon]
MSSATPSPIKMELLTKIASSKENIRVLLRVRPNFDQEDVIVSEEGEEIAARGGCIRVDDERTVRIMPVQVERLRYGLTKMLETYGSSHDKIDKVFKYDRVFNEESKTEDIFALISETLPPVLDGFTTTVLSYGPTFGGKSYTMVGTEREPGIIPRTIDFLFKLLDEKRCRDESNPDIVTEVEVSYVELHNNIFRNLLKYEQVNKAGPPSTPKLTTTSVSEAAVTEVDDVLNPFTERGDRVDIHETPALGVFLVGSNLRVPVNSAEDTFNVLRRGEANRMSRASNSVDGSTRYVTITFSPFVVFF